MPNARQFLGLKPGTSAWFALLPFIALHGCGESTELEPVPPPPPCPPTNTVAAVTDLNYPESDCRAPTIQAQGRLDNGHYRKACRAADPEAPVPPSVVSARVTECRTTQGRGVFLDVEVCCGEGVAQAVEPESVVRGRGPKCSIRYTPTRVGDLHYPEAESCDAIRSEAEAALGSMHYRKACKAATPRAGRERRVLEARVVECRSGGGATGVSIDVELCCEAKVFEESDFTELVWRRSSEDVQAALGAPDRITEQTEGVYWNYSIEVARDDRIFPEVTLVFADNQVNSYFF